MAVHSLNYGVNGAFATAALLCLGALTTGAFAQGWVTMGNGPTTLISYGPAGNSVALSANEPGTFYFSLLISGTATGPFTFAGMYGTNSALAGRISGYTAGVLGWPGGITMFYEVAGWSANFGPHLELSLAGKQCPCRSY